MSIWNIFWARNLLYAWEKMSRTFQSYPKVKRVWPRQGWPWQCCRTYWNHQLQSTVKCSRGKGQWLGTRQVTSDKTRGKVKVTSERLQVMCDKWQVNSEGEVRKYFQEKYNYHSTVKDKQTCEANPDAACIFEPWYLGLICTVHFLFFHLPISWNFFTCFHNNHGTSLPHATSLKYKIQPLCVSCGNFHLTLFSCHFFPLE